MAFTAIMTTETSVQAKAGDGRSSDFSEAMQNDAVLRAESQVNTIARYNFSDNYATLNADVKHIISEIVSSLVAIEWIAYDYTGYLNGAREAEGKINYLNNQILLNKSLLLDKETQRFINGA